MALPSVDTSDDSSRGPINPAADPTRHADRRTSARYAARHIDISLRPRGHLQQIDAELLDFNRFGLAIVIQNPLALDRLVYLSLACGAVRVTRVVGVVHNITQHEDRYRCGIRFRTQSSLQQDAELVEASLVALEESIQEQLDLAADPDSSASAVY